MKFCIEEGSSLIEFYEDRILTITLHKYLFDWKNAETVFYFHLCLLLLQISEE